MTTSIDYYTFSANGTMPDIFYHQGRFSQLTMGQVGAENFGGGSLLLQKTTLDGGLHTIRTITAADFALLQDKTLRLELPDETELKVTLTGSTTPNLYVEHRNQKDDSN
tara:strand:- start:33252 stop:33578 length:327 start_codon:yes stop_codon:yes gene_type:complete